MTDKRAAYYSEATDWALDREAQARTNLSFARIFGLLALIIAVVEGGALIYLAPLKTLAPIPVLVDRQTGYVQVLKSDGRSELRADQALTQSLLAQYVIARESFNITNVAADFRKVGLWSTGAARQEFVTLMPASNPESPLRRYPRSAILETRIKSISPVGPMVSLVRFETRRRDQDGRSAPVRAWASVVAYRFTDAPMSVEDRLVNPLGFQVVRYHRDAETLAAPDSEDKSASIAVASSPIVAVPIDQPPPRGPNQSAPMPLGPPPGATFLPAPIPPQAQRR
jgi:type IV secretion system protein VirB8